MRLYNFSANDYSNSEQYGDRYILTPTSLGDDKAERDYINGDACENFNKLLNYWKYKI